MWILHIVRDLWVKLQPKNFRKIKNLDKWKIRLKHYHRTGYATLDHILSSRNNCPSNGINKQISTSNVLKHVNDLANIQTQEIEKPLVEVIRLNHFEINCKRMTITLRKN